MFEWAQVLLGALLEPPLSWSSWQVLYVIATRIRFMCPMHFNKFPMDTQTCKFQASLEQFKEFNIYNKKNIEIEYKNLKTFPMDNYICQFQNPD